ncbi:MFS transporter [Streptomyces shenzhenensis]|uniref:MFS transporter n=1 Tax=Streptomyces shenzhenensis TaxID=943815 RepID=UPI00369D9F0F
MRRHCPMDLATRRRRRSLYVFFFIPGIAMSSWVTRTPDVRDRLDASTAQMGLVLFGLSVGSMLGILCSGRLVARYGSRPVIGLGTSLVIASTAVIAAGSYLSSAAVVTAGLFTFGAGTGSGEVAVNIDGADVERATGTTVLPVLHGFFSLGTVIGAVAGMAATAGRFPTHWHLAVTTLASAVAFGFAFRAVPAGVGRRENRSARSAGHSSGRLWRESKLLLIGAVVLAMALAEGAANDWLPLLMVDGHGLDPALGSLVYAGFAAAMTLGRFGGGFFVERYGRGTVVRASALSASLGLILVIFSDSAVLAGTAVLLWGLGASLGFPLTLSAAGDSGPDQTARVSLVATVGYVAFLVGPPGLGFLGDHFGLRTAMIAVLACTIVAVLIAPAVNTPRAAGASGSPLPAPADAAVPAESERTGPQGQSGG